MRFFYRMRTTWKHPAAYLSSRYIKIIYPRKGVISFIAVLVEPDVTE
jgi:hypothetical protein